MQGFNFTEIFILTGSLQGIIFAIILFIKSVKYRQVQNVWLGSFILFFSIVVLKGWYLGSEFYIKIPDFLFLPIYCSLGIGPSFYFYVKRLLQKDLRLKKIHLLHFLLPLIQFIYNLIVFIKPISERLSHFHNNYLFFILPIEDIIGILSLASYYYLSFRIIKKYQNSIQLKLNEDRRNLYKWINHFIIASYVMLLSWVILSLIDFIKFDYTKSYSFYYLIYIIMISILYWIIYRGFISTTKIQPEKIDNSNKVSYSLPVKDAENYIVILIQKMEKDKVYLKPKLTLSELADNIGINTKYLSQIINQKFGKSFTEYVNAYRIEYAKKELLSIQNTKLTISAISENCGFNSKSTFNDVFKKVTNQTPSLFIKNNS